MNRALVKKFLAITFSIMLLFWGGAAVACLILKFGRVEKKEPS